MYVNEHKDSYSNSILEVLNSGDYSQRYFNFNVTSDIVGPVYISTDIYNQNMYD